MCDIEAIALKGDVSGLNHQRVVIIGTWEAMVTWMRDSSKLRVTWMSLLIMHLSGGLSSRNLWWRMLILTKKEGGSKSYWHVRKASYERKGQSYEDEEWKDFKRNLDFMKIEEMTRPVEGQEGKFPCEERKQIDWVEARRLTKA